MDKYQKFCGFFLLLLPLVLLHQHTQVPNSIPHKTLLLPTVLISHQRNPKLHPRTEWALQVDFASVPPSCRLVKARGGRTGCRPLVPATQTLSRAFHRHRLQKMSAAVATTTAVGHRNHRAQVRTAVVPVGRSVGRSVSDPLRMRAMSRIAHLPPTPTKYPQMTRTFMLKTGT